MKNIVVTLGASAGGLAALESFFGSVPDKTDFSFVIVQHLSPDFKSLMSELLAAYTQLPIREVESGLHLQPGHIYLIPAGRLMSIKDGIFKLRPRNVEEMPINVFMQSLASDYGNRAIAVVFSGTGTDGTLGCKAIREAGGLVLAQEPGTAEFSSMPESVIRKQYQHYSLDPQGMWHLIHYYKGDVDALQKEIGSSVESESSSSENVTLGYTDLFALLKRLYQIDFSSYKINSVNRRIERRMNRCEVNTVPEYLQYTAEHKEESDALYQDLLIGVTEFIRDPEAYRALAADVIRPVLAGEDPPDEYRIWVAGCASGQEAYSIAILADDIARECDYRGNINVFATDIHKRSVQRAGNGVYSQEEVANLSPEQLDRYFKVNDSGEFCVKPELRRRVVFAQHNLLADPPFTRMDLVTCRNLLIYLKPKAQDSVLSSLHYALKMGGALFLGTSESLGDLGNAFKTVSSKYKIYCKKADYKGHTRPQQLFSRPSMENPGANVQIPQSSSSITIDRNLLQAYDLILKRYAPSGVLITRDREVRHYFGDASHYFAARQGRADNDVLSLFTGDLKLAISSTLQRVLSQNQTVRSEGVCCTTRHGEAVVDVTITPYIENGRDLGLLLVTFEPRDKAETIKDAEASESFNVDAQTHSRILMLEDELRSTKENLHATVEQLQTSNEELQAINEEVQVSNEELQSTNEELHSMNEELYTVNAELEQKNLQLIELNEDHENLLTSTEDGVLYIDREKRIRKYNPASSFAFSLLPQDIGRPIEHIAYNLEGQTEMLRDIESVLETGERSERELKTNTGISYLRRFTPFLDANGEVAGVVLTFTDITEVNQMRSRLARAMESAHMAWWEWDLQTDRLDVHAEGQCILGYDCDNVAHNSEFWFERCHPDEVEWVRKSLQDCLDGKVEEWVCEHRFARSNTKPAAFEWVYERGSVTRRSASGRPLEMCGTTMNIHARKMLELDILASKESAEKALSVKSEFLSVMSHEIRTPLNGICGMTEMLKLELKDPQYQKYLGVISTCSDSLLTLINGILDYSKAESGRLSLSPRECNIEHVVEDVIRIVTNSTGKKQVTVSVEFHQDGQIYLLDDMRLRQILLNIIGNAIKFSDKEGKVDVRLRSITGREEYLEFRVEDEGVGISSEFMEHLFDPFSQQDSSNTRKFGGVGLGLSICKQLVELMGGRIRVESRKGAGTSVSFTIRAEKVGDASPEVIHPDEAEDKAASVGSIIPADSPSKKVIVVDDDHANRVVMETLLNQCGFGSLSAHSMDDGIRRLGDNSEIYAALIDLHMPGGSGYDLLKCIRNGGAGECHKNLPAFACTADASPETKRKVKQSGFNGLLVKPVPVAKLSEALGLLNAEHSSNGPNK